MHMWVNIVFLYLFQNSWVLSMYCFVFFEDATLNKSCKTITM